MLTRAVADDPQSAAAYTRLALAELRCRHYPQARDGAQRALVLDAENLEAQRILAFALVSCGSKREARQAAVRGVELAPEDHVGYVLLAERLLALDDLAGALEAANEAVRLAPEEPIVHHTLGLVKLRREDWRGGEAAAREALRFVARNPPVVNDLAVLILNNLAVALKKQSRPAEAAEALEQAVKINPDDPVLRTNLFHLRRGGIAKHLSASTRALIAGDRRARRFHPRRWDWSRLKRQRPLWWILLFRLTAPLALAIHLVVLAILLWLVLSSVRAVDVVGGVVVGAVAATSAVMLPLSIQRTRTWWGIRHRPRSSWAPNRPDEP